MTLLVLLVICLIATGPYLLVLLLLRSASAARLRRVLPPNPAASKDLATVTCALCSREVPRTQAGRATVTWGDGHHHGRRRRWVCAECQAPNILPEATS